MDTKKFLIASAVLFVVISALEFVINGVLLSGMYKQLSALWRPEAEMQQMMFLFWAGYAASALLFTFIYTKGYEKTKGTLTQGLRYGFYIGLLLCLPSNLMWYAVLPIPAALALSWFAAGMVEALIAGAIVGLIYKK
jgi:hypothetical protein